MSGRRGDAWVGRVVSRPVAVALVAVIVALQFGGAVSNGFVLDDSRAIHGNRCVTTGPGLACAMTHDFWGRPGREVGRTYRPLAVLSLALDWGMGGGKAWVFHLSNIFQHLLACLVVLWFFWMLLPGRRAESLATAVVFTSLAVHTEAVAGIVGRADLMATLFGAGALGSHLRWTDTGRPVWLVTGLALLVAALLSHEIAVLIPAMALVCDWASDRLASARHRRLVGYLGLALVAGGYLVLRVQVMGRLVGPPPVFINNPAVEADGLGRALFALASVARSLAAMAFPFSLAAEHGYAAVTVPTSLADVEVLAGIALTAVLVASLVFAAGRAPLVAAGCGVLLVSLALLSNGPILLPTAFAERLLYLPSLGFAMLVGGLFGLAPARDRWPAVIGIVAAVLAPNMVVGASYTRDWQSSVRLFSRAAQVNPRSVRAELNLGLALNRAGRHREAIAPLRRALHIYPRLPGAAAELAMAYDETGDVARAGRWFWTAYRTAPSTPHVAANYARFLQRHGRPAEARRVLDQLRASRKQDGP